jgi:hypothetical protein
MRPGIPISLSLEEHRELGAELRSARAQMQQLCQLVLAVYGPNNQAAFTFIKVVETLDRLAMDMQAQAARDLPGFPTDKLY